MSPFDVAIAARRKAAARRVSDVITQAVNGAEPGWRALELCPRALSRAAGIDFDWLIDALERIGGEPHYAGRGVVVTFDRDTRLVVATRTH